MNFVLDPFQEKAIAAVEAGQSVFISAPTGSGKTLIAEAVIEKAMRHGLHVVYTAPIKALSNQKFRDFRARFGDEKVGILTGDVSINADAPILIMTTEIYRNSLFENSERIRKVGWVIFDEIHYLDDPERGTVWEEAILFGPSKTGILALSATVPNVDQLADWVRTIHPGQPLTVIQEDHRPVPLHFQFQCQGHLLPGMRELRREGYLNRPDWRPDPRERRRGIHPMRAKPNRLEPLIDHLIREDRLPAIYFVFGRRRTETLAWEANRFDFLTDSERGRILDFYDSLLERYSIAHERSAQDLRPLIEQGIAYHHAGMLPTLKETVEQLFTAKHIKLIFTTETFALGINMPARSVIFDELSKFYGTGFRNLTTRDFYQMAGRAGRRGMDKEGFVTIRVNPHDIPFPEVERILYGKPEPIRSQLNTSYATLLNLYRNIGPKLVEIYPRSFHAFQYGGKRREKGLHQIQQKLKLLEEMNYLTPEGLTAKGEFASSLFGYELIMAEMHDAGFLDGLTDSDLSVLLSSFVYEPRKGQALPRLKPAHEKLRKTAEHHFERIYHREVKHHLPAKRTSPHFHIAKAIEAWCRGETFHRLFRETDVDEGELVRHFRMVVQLLRELAHSSYTPECLRQTAFRAEKKIKRDIVDAEQQLRT